MSADFLALFREGIAAEMDFLVTEFGFTLEEANANQFFARSSHLEIEFGRDTGEQLQVILTRTSLHPLKEQTSLYLLAEYYNPETAYRPEVFYDRPEAFPTEIRRAAELLRRYGAPSLYGDFSDWPKLHLLLQEIAQLNKLEEAQVLKIYQMKQQRNSAEEAWQQKDFEQVISTYETLTEVLTGAEKRRLEYAWSKFMSS